MSEPAKPKNPRDAAPSAALKRLGDMLVGIWQLSGGAEGTIRYEWMEGGRPDSTRRSEGVRSADQALRSDSTRGTAPTPSVVPNPA